MEMLKDVQDYMISGGFVMPPLMLLTFALWYQLTERYFILNENKNIKISLRKQLQNVNPYALDYLFLQVQTHMKKGKMTIKAIVGSAPLLGLLGTVNGMITTFDSLGDMTLFSQTGGVAVPSGNKLAGPHRRGQHERNHHCKGFYTVSYFDEGATYIYQRCRNAFRFFYLASARFLRPS